MEKILELYLSVKDKPLEETIPLIREYVPEICERGLHRLYNIGHSEISPDDMKNVMSNLIYIAADKKNVVEQFKEKFANMPRCSADAIKDKTNKNIAGMIDKYIYPSDDVIIRLMCYRELAMNSRNTSALLLIYLSALAYYTGLNSVIRYNIFDRLLPTGISPEEIKLILPRLEDHMLKYRRLTVPEYIGIISDLKPKLTMTKVEEIVEKGYMRYLNNRGTDEDGKMICPICFRKITLGNYGKYYAHRKSQVHVLALKKARILSPDVNYFDVLDKYMKENGITR